MQILEMDFNVHRLKGIYSLKRNIFRLILPSCKIFFKFHNSKEIHVKTRLRVGSAIFMSINSSIISSIILFSPLCKSGEDITNLGSHYGQTYSIKAKFIPPEYNLFHK